MEADSAIVQGYARQIGFLSRPRCSTVAAGAPIYPVVEAPLQAVNQLLNVVLAETGVERSLAIRFAVSVGVLQEQNVRGDACQHASPPRHDRGGKAQTLGKGGAVLIEAVAIPIFEKLNLAGMDIPRADAAIWIAGHLSYI